jgi:hypothetical protein
MGSGAARAASVNSVATHKAATTACGRAQPGELFCGNWLDVTCPGCLTVRPESPPACFFCGRPVNGSCVFLYRPSKALLHALCAERLRACPGGQRLLQRFPDAFQGPAWNPWARYPDPLVGGR